MCNTCVIMVLPYRSICFGIRDSKIEGVATKLLYRATLWVKSYKLQEFSWNDELKELESTFRGL